MARLTEKQFLKNLENTKKATPINGRETVSEKEARKKELLGNYKKFFEYYFPNYATSKVDGKTVTTPCAWFHVFVAHMLLHCPVIFFVLEWFRGSAKSTHACMGYPLFLKCHGELKTMLLVGQTEKKAQRLIADIQVQLMGNQRFIQDYGTQVRQGSWQDLEFITNDGCAFFALGIGQSPRGTRNEENRPDYIVADDCDTKILSKNQARINEMVEWIYGDLIETFDIGNQRFLLVNNKPFKHSILGKVISDKFTSQHITKLTKSFFQKTLNGLLKQYKTTALEAIQYSVHGDWHHLKVNACAPNFEPTWSEKYTVSYWQRKCESTIRRIWSGEFLNTPITEGVDFKEDWIQWEKIPPLHEMDHLVAYADPSWKNTKTSDYKAISFWGKKGRYLYKIKQYCRKDSITNFVAWFYNLHETLPSRVTCDYYMETNFMQDMILDEFAYEGDKREYQLPIRGDNRKKDDKYFRIQAMAPLYERGFIIYNIDEKESPDMKEATEQLLCIEPDYSTPDDAPDADEGAIFILQRSGRQRRNVIRTGKRVLKYGY